ncbi:MULTISPECIES: PadR family transcriptional regulator [unclassified Microbacterium]|uniref:PadR family transcriptional regulator n=1 Tax=unclassified Microbacterium TaxID=2609290 RepID=UPI0012F783D0|nr:PadR family transcriptional regulator [Microbacterium sp. MAH-37]MVQ41454.1 PadR family transcriptional regulator [Microbacterium sp. MAH-37]
MNGSFSSNGFGNPFDLGSGGRGPGSLWEAMDQLRSAFEQRIPTPRMGRGDVRTAVLALLAEQPMHGYQIINEISERSGGTWKPSAGSVYPTLQLLADEGLIEAVEDNGRKTYSLTEAGREATAEDKQAPWEASASRPGAHLTALPKAGMELAAAAAQVGRTGSPEQVQQAVAVLEDARRKLYAILAAD